MEMCQKSKGASIQPLLFLFSVLYGLMIVPPFYLNSSILTDRLAFIASPKNHIVGVKERFGDVAVGERFVVSDSNDLESFLDKMRRELPELFKHPVGVDNDRDVFFRVIRGDSEVG